MSNILVVAEQRDNHIKNISFEVASLAKQLSDNVSVVVIGSALADQAKEFSEYGIADIHLVEQDELKQYSYQAYSSIVKDIATSKSADVIMIGATALGKELAAHVGSQLNAAVAQDCTQINDDLTAVRPVYAGKALSTVKLNTDIKVFSIRANTVQASTNAVEAKIISESQHSIIQLLSKKYSPHPAKNWTLQKPELLSPVVAVWVDLKTGI